MPYIRVSDTNLAEKTCKSCAYFRLHYIRYSDTDYSELSYGHCVKPRLKKRYSDDKAC